MQIIKKKSFRSTNTFVNQPDDMFRIIVDMDVKEYAQFAKLVEAQVTSTNSGRNSICPKCDIDTSHAEQTVLRSCSGCGLTYAVKQNP